MIIALAFVAVIILALIYLIKKKVGYVVNIIFVITAGIFNYISNGML